MTISHRLPKAITITAAIFLSNGGAAQDLQDIYIELDEAGYLHTYATSVTILDNHPNCNGAGEVAFAMALDADHLDFAVEGDRWDGTVKQYNRSGATLRDDACILGTKSRTVRPIVDYPERVCDSDELEESNNQILAEEAPKCFIITRRGGEEIREQIDCGPQSEPDALNTLIEDAAIQLDVGASADICQSLAGIWLMQSAWTVSLDMGGQVQTYEGALGQFPEGYAQGDGAPKVEVRYSNAWGDLKTPNADPPENIFEVDPKQSSSLQLKVEITPFLLAGTEDAPVNLTALRSFTIDVD